MSYRPCKKRNSKIELIIVVIADYSPLQEPHTVSEHTPLLKNVSYEKYAPQFCIDSSPVLSLFVTFV